MSLFTNLSMYKCTMHNTYWNNIIIQYIMKCNFPVFLLCDHGAHLVACMEGTSVTSGAQPSHPLLHLFHEDCRIHPSVFSRSPALPNPSSECSAPEQTLKHSGPSPAKSE